MMLPVFSSDARKDLLKLSKPIALRLEEKIRWYAHQEDPLEFAEPLKGEGKFYRFRIGDYRAIFSIEQGKVIILLVHAVKNRKEAYR